MLVAQLATDPVHPMPRDDTWEVSWLYCHVSEVEILINKRTTLGTMVTHADSPRISQPQSCIAYHPPFPHMMHRQRDCVSTADSACTSELR